MTQAAILAASGSPGTTTGFKNRIINGNMNVDQRNNGGSVTNVANASTYTLDRWFYYATQASKFTVQQNSGNAPSTQGFSQCVKITSSSAYSVAAGDLFTFQQAIEGNNVSDLAWGTASAKTVALSFWVNSSLTGTFGGAVYNNANDRCYVFSYSIPVANTWTQISITVPGCTDGTWLTNSGIGLLVSFSLGMGSNYTTTAGSWNSSAKFSVTGGVNVVSTSGATFYVTGVQFEVGTTATNFDFRSYGQELVLCQRYYTAFTIGQVSNSWSANSNQYLSICLPVQMRTYPSAAILSGSWSGTAPSTNYQTVNQYAWATSAYFYGNGGLVFGFSAEL